MSELSPLHEVVFANFRKVFGEPNHVLGKDHHWSLRPPPFGVPIYVLIKRSVTNPAVWVFDPYDHRNGVVNAALTCEQQVNEIIEQIRLRLSKASGMPSV